MSQKKEILKQVGVYSSATLVTQIITLTVAILSRLFLGPAQTGIWAVLQVVITYASLSVLGITEAATREIPFYLGKGQRARAHEIKNVVFSFALLSSTIVSIGILLYALIYRPRLSHEIFLGLLAVSGVIVLQRLSDLLITFLRAYKQFAIASQEMIYSAVFNAIAVIFLSYRYELYGFMIAMLVSFLFNIAYMMLRFHFDLEWLLEGKIIKEGIAYGFPLMILGLLTTIFLSIDKIMIAHFLGFEALGLYGIAILGADYLAKFPLSVGTVLLPNFHGKYGAAQNKYEFRSYLKKVSNAFCYSMPLLIGFIWFFSPWVIHHILPEFKECLPALKMLILSSYFSALSNPYENFIIMVKGHLKLFPIIAIAAVLAVAFNYLALKIGWGIWGVALATTVVFILKLLAVYLLSEYVIDKTYHFEKHLFSILGQFAFMVVVLRLSSSLFLDWGLGIRSVLQFLVFVFIYIPILLRFNREFELWDTLKERLGWIRSLEE